MVKIETRCRIPIWWTFGQIAWHIIPEPHATLQSAVTWRNQCRDRATLQCVIIPSAILKMVFRHILFFVFNAVWALTSGGFRIVSDTFVLRTERPHEVNNGGNMSDAFCLFWLLRLINKNLLTYLCIVPSQISEESVARHSPFWRLWTRSGTNTRYGDSLKTLYRQIQHFLTLYGHIKTAQQRTIIQQYGDWYTGRWWVGCYTGYSEEGPGRPGTTPSPLLAEPNVTAHPSTASVPTSYHSMWQYEFWRVNVMHSAVHGSDLSNCLFSTLKQFWRDALIRDSNTDIHNWKAAF